MSKKNIVRLSRLEYDTVERIAYGLGLQVIYVPGRKAMLINKRCTPKHVFYIRRQTDGSLIADNRFDDQVIYLDLFSERYNKRMSDTHKIHKNNRLEHNAEHMADKVINDIVPIVQDFNDDTNKAKLAKMRAKFAVKEIAQKVDNAEFHIVEKNYKVKPGELVCSVRRKS